MFGDMSGMIQKLEDAQKKIEETKIRLNSVLIDEASVDGKIKIKLTANSEIKAITIDDSLLADAEELEDYLVITLNKALSKAAQMNEQEMAAAAKNGMPDIPGMDLFK
ncbi:YbaB/EbfC family nucleoid-associated protein [Polaribacter litorisediminis]|uniref:YbaB/EbfC family nucleoid-associated protein n=1 Tax=Polaribacter litorisediminis TaxID=1908341 RepID=UPI001CC08793|nr:YbaB/EbfC family nucleoid-associated protein [Polaribacter litorisediminis]UAM99302.1 YbaB/EbfC family nucleoid-associated protein [Polaribacter litorisediminis]